mgnify:CR=1 FL=1
MRSLRYLNSILTVLAVLLALQLWTTWTMTPQATVATSAQAKGGIPDAGSQRKQMVDLLKTLTQQSSELNAMFASGSARVSVEAGAPE